MSTRGTFLLAIATTVILVAFAACVADAGAECDQHGGVLVRGAFWFECVEPRK